MIALVQPELPLKKKRAKASLPKGIKVGDMVTDLKDGTIGKVVSLSDRHINIKTDDSIQSHNLELGIPKLEIHTHPNQSVVFAIGDRVTLAMKTYAPSGKFGMGATVISKKWDKKITCTRIKVQFDDGVIYPCIQGSGWFKKLEAEEKESCLPISTALAELEPSLKLADAQEKSVQSHTSTSTKRRNKSIKTTSQSLASIPTSETITHQKESISIQEDSHVLELPTLETNRDSITQSQHYGLNTSESSMRDNPNLLSLKTLPQLSITDYEQYLGDSEWLDIVGTIHKSYKLLSLEAPKKEKGCLSLPTLTTGLGSGRNAGQTRLEKALKDKGFRLDTQALSIEGMCLLFGFPPNWAKSLYSVPRESPDAMMLEPCLGEQSILTVPSQLSNESSTSIAVSANNIDARLQFLLEQRDRLIASNASPQGVWLSVGQVYKKDFRQVVWKSAHEHKWLGGNKSRYIGKENSDEHISAIAQHKAGQELRKIEREIKKLQVKS